MVANPAGEEEKSQRKKEVPQNMSKGKVKPTTIENRIETKSQLSMLSEPKTIDRADEVRQSNLS